jgi:hypothetical protein
VLDSAIRELTVPDFTSVQVSFGTPRFYRARTIRDMRALKENASAAPTADREFSRTERVMVRMEAYTPGAVQPTVTARLLNRSGTPMSDVPVAMSGTTALELTLANLAAAEYILELTAKTEAGSVQELLAFKINR